LGKKEYDEVKEFGEQKGLDEDDAGNDELGSGVKAMYRRRNVPELKSFKDLHVHHLS
jgi:hypothetical protein